MRQIRKKIYETNSSSTHAIVIANNTSEDFKNNLPNKILFEANEFGWEFERYQDMQSRANYLFSSILSLPYPFFDEYMPKIKNILEKWGVQVEHPKVIRVKDSNHYKLENGGFYGVDHVGELEDFLKVLCDDEVLLMNYLFSNESFIATGNDNEDDELDSYTSADNILYKYFKGN